MKWVVLRSINITLEEALQMVKIPELGIEIRKKTHFLVFVDDVALLKHKEENKKGLIRVLVE